MSMRPTTWAMVWYPLVCAALAVGFGSWWWSQCGGDQRPAACRSDIAPGMLMFFVAIVAVGMVALGIIWLIGRPIARRSAGAGSALPGTSTDEPENPGQVPAHADSDSDSAPRG